MTEKVSLSGWGLFLLAGVLAAGAAATAALLHYVLRAPMPFVLLVSCLSLPALTLLFYIGFLIYRSPKAIGYLIPLKALAMLSVAMSLAILLDFVLPERTAQLTVQAKVPAGWGSILHVGSYRQAVDARRFKTVHEGDRLAVKTTPLFGRIEAITAADMDRPGFRRPMSEKAFMIAAAAMFFTAVGVFRFTPRKGDPCRNIAVYFLLIVPSYVLSLIAAGLWIKLFLVHVLRAVDKM